MVCWMRFAQKIHRSTQGQKRGGREHEFQRTFFRAVHHQQPDRVPVDFVARPDVTERLIEYLGLPDEESLLRTLGVDIRYISSPRHYTEFEKKTNGTLESTSENRGAHYIFHSDGSYENAMGVRYRTSSDGQYDGWISGPFSEDDEPDVSTFQWPALDCFESVEQIREKVARYKKDYIVVGRLNYPFKTCWQMRGMEDYFCDLIVNPEFASDLWGKCAEYEMELGLRMIRAGVDVVALYGDIANQKSLMYGLEQWRQVDKPHFREMIRRFREENPDIIVFYHSDGNMEALIPDLIEIGVDILNPIQPECMDVDRVKELYGKNFTMHGTISIQQTLPFGTVKDVNREISDRIRVCQEGGGFVLCPSNLIQNDTPLENILEIYRAARSFAL